MVPDCALVTLGKVNGSGTHVLSTRGRLLTVFVGIVAFVSFMAWRWGVVRQLPVWDGAMGMTPAALTLESLDFDVGALLTLPDFRAGGPNLHALSSFTWLTAGMVRLFGSYHAALPWLHVVSFLLLGAIAAAVFHIVHHVTGSASLAIAASILAVTFPPMVVQGSDVYLDLPLAVAVTWTLAMLLDGRYVWSSAFACVAASVKPSAAIMLPAIAVILLTRRHFRMNWAKLLLLPAIISVVPLLIDSHLQRGDGNAAATVGFILSITIGYLRRMPVFLALTMAVLILTFVALWGPVTGSIPRKARELMLSASSLVVGFALFFVLNPLVSKGVFALPRYTTMMSPLISSALVVGFWAIWRRRIALAASAAVALVFLLNMHGALAPRSHNSYPLAERSLAYEQLLDVQIEAFSAFAVLAGAMPAYYDHFAHFRFEYPQMGWASARPTAGMPVHTTPDFDAELSDMPPEFALLIGGPGLGGRKLEALKRQAMDDPSWAVEVSDFTEGEFSNQIAIARFAG